MPKLKPFLRRDLDVLFVALNAPKQSYFNGHWFSGKTSAFYKLLTASGLAVQQIPKHIADEIVFGTNDVNYGRLSFGVVDLVDDLVETDSKRVRVTEEHVARLLQRIREYAPRHVCIIHSKVRAALNRHGKLNSQLQYGLCGKPVPECDAEFVVNYFPNGNAIRDDVKIAIFRLLLDRLSVNAR